MHKCTEAGWSAPVQQHYRSKQSVCLYSCITVLGKVYAPLFSHKRCSWLNFAWIKKCQKKIVTLAGGCAPEASTLPPVTVSRIFTCTLLLCPLFSMQYTLQVISTKLRPIAYNQIVNLNYVIPIIHDNFFSPLFISIR